MSHDNPALGHSPSHVGASDLFAALQELFAQWVDSLDQRPVTQDERATRVSAFGALASLAASNVMEDMT